MQGHGGSGTDPRNSGHKEGELTWLSQGTVHIYNNGPIHLLECFWEVGDNQWENLEETHASMEAI